MVVSSRTVRMYNDKIEQNHIIILLLQNNKTCNKTTMLWALKNIFNVYYDFFYFRTTYLGTLLPNDNQNAVQTTN